MLLPALQSGEFSGRHREIYSVRITLSVRREVEHATEGWIPMPASEPQELLSASKPFSEESEAKASYETLESLLLK